MTEVGRKFHFDADEDGKVRLRSAVFQALGRASVCWESMAGTGIFQEQDATEVAEVLLELIRDELGPPGHRMGMATTKQLLEELECRMNFEDQSPLAKSMSTACQVCLERLEPDVLNYKTSDG